MSDFLFSIILWNFLQRYGKHFKRIPSSLLLHFSVFKGASTVRSCALPDHNCLRHPWKQGVHRSHPGRSPFQSYQHTAWLGRWHLLRSRCSGTECWTKPETTTNHSLIFPLVPILTDKFSLFFSCIKDLPFYLNSSQLTYTNTYWIKSIKHFEVTECDLIRM